MNPDDRQKGIVTPVMDIQRPRPGTTIKQAGSTSNTMAPADNIASSASAINSEDQQAIQEASKPRSRSPNRKLPIILSIISVIVLVIGGGIFWYINAQQKAPVAQQATEPVNTDAQRVNTTDIDNTISDIDKTLNTVDDSKDITPNDISDTALGI